MSTTAASTTTTTTTNASTDGLPKLWRVACIGGGQLGRMMALEAPRLNVQMFFLDPAGSDCPAAAAVPSAQIITGSLLDAAAIRRLVETSRAHVLTAEIEHINCDALQEIEAQNRGVVGSGGDGGGDVPVVSVQPSSCVMRLIQDKYMQKRHFMQHGIAVAPFCECSSVEQIKEAAVTLGLPLMLKARKGAYDGRGNAVLESTDEAAIQQALSKLLGNVDAATNTMTSTDLMLYAEGWIDFACEVAVMVVRSAAADAGSTTPSGTTNSPTTTTTSTRCYPAVNAIQQDSICRVVLAPARNISADIRKAAEQLAMAAIDSLPAAGGSASGVFGVELFVTKAGGQVLLNEVAPRPHNTGHYTQDACTVSQFENHLRGVCGMPLGSTRMIVEAAAMVNVLGQKTQSSVSNAAALGMETAALHWYGKQECREGRKMGHINLTANSHGELDNDLRKLLQLEGIPESTVFPGRKTAATTSTAVSVTPLVGVIMGSHSDLPTMQAAVQVLQQFNIAYEVDVVSAHRTPDKLVAYSRGAAGRGLRVLICGAGGAAHLPGMVAAMTPLPVIGVPVKTSTLSGVDSLYSIVQMPRGVPVATVAIGNATNAGLLAVRILSTSRPELRDKMEAYQSQMKESVDEVSAKLLDLGSDAFLQQMGDDSKNTTVNV